jgi:2-succinyl-5-enolpyruvyl-6-hydroxy-3-cyclohexene-1-carboxylate synthase
MNSKLASDIMNNVARLCEHVVICPGSRSTPLALAAKRHPNLTTHIVLDERAAGFFALGIGKRTNRPAAVITTSGTAVANLHPATCEAHQAMVPLLLLSADRPERLRDTGANQTMDQRAVLQPHLRAEFQGNPDWHEIQEALYGLIPGPVHVNQSFEEPLLDGEFTLAEQELVPLREPLGEEMLLEGKGVIFAGPNSPEISAPVPVIVDGLSAAPGTRGTTKLPEVDWVIHLGGAATSKSLNAELIAHPNRIRVGRRQWDEGNPTWVDADIVSVEADAWQLEETTLTPEAGEEIALSNVQGDLFVGNSLAVRAWNKIGNRCAWANRGVSGIDGNIATASGMSLAAPITAVVGDLTFQHDIGSLALCKGRNIRIVVLNNGGGRIFHRLAVANEPEFEELFLTPQKLNIAAAAKAFGLSYQKCVPERVGQTTAQVVEVIIDPVAFQS